MNTIDFLKEDELFQKVDQWEKQIPSGFIGPGELSHCALIVVDMQNDFLESNGLLKVWGGPAVIPNINRLIHLFRDLGRPVVFTRHVYEKPEIDGGATARWWKADNTSQLLRESTWHSELHQSLDRKDGDILITKRRYSAFFATDLELLLRNYGVRQVAITGVSTNICCEATAHDALFRDFDVFFLIDGTGATDEAAHLAVLRSIALSYGKPVTTDQVIRSLTKG
jgi:nicotinamidase-related amidase